MRSRAGDGPPIPNDDRIMQYMRTAQNIEAVYAIERACVNKTSIPIAPDKRLLESSMCCAAVEVSGGL
jgi:hypothetical protein